jgi:prepilin-type N-terminal cleavage/methylation domain-containing protein
MADSRPAFTLIELVAVIVVVSLVSAAVIIRWSAVHHPAIVESTIQKLQFVDQHMRRFARSRGQACGIEFNCEHNRICKIYGEEQTALASIGGTIRLDDIDCGGERPSSKTVLVPFSRIGTTPTYGLHLVGPGQRETWLVFAGISGKLITCDTEREWHATFGLFSPQSL